MPRPEQREHTDGTTSWRVRFTLNRRRRTETFYDQAAATNFCDTITVLGVNEAYRILEDRRRSRLAGTTRETPTLDEWADRYVTALTGASAATKDGYRSLYAHAWQPRLGQLQLDAITRELISSTIADLQTRGGRTGTGYSDKSIANQHGLLSAMLATAVLDGILSANPADRIRLPRRTGHEDTDPRFLTHDEYATLRNAALEHHRLLLDFLVCTGLRWGEFVALEVRDVDLTNANVAVTKSAKWVGTSPNRRRVIGPVKTPKSKRTISLPPELVADLRAHVAGRGSRDRLFTAPRGGPLVHHNFFFHVWRRACDKVAMTDPYPRIHDLRHTHASWLIAEGVSMKALQERLGHESIKTTMDLYAHLMPGAQQEAADATSRALGRALGLRVVA